MSVITPGFVMKFEDRMKSITINEYARLTSNLWWQGVARTRPSQSARELVTWLLSTATIKAQGKGGNIAFDDLVAQYTTLEPAFAGAGLKITKAQLTDLYNGVVGGEGMDVAGKWSSDIGAYMAYWPQQLVAQLLKDGDDVTKVVGYDGKAFFASDHGLNPYNTSAGTFANLHKTAGGASGAGAVPIDESVSADVALSNLSKIMANIATIKMPNGTTPRFLRPKWILCGPRLYPRAVQLTSAKFLGQAASGGAGTGDVEMLIKALGYATPIMADEFAGYESDTTYFVICEQITSVDLGGVIYLEREPFQINYYDLTTQAQLNRANELEWHCIGRNAVAPGHPYLIHKCKGA